MVERPMRTVALGAQSVVANPAGLSQRCNKHVLAYGERADNAGDSLAEPNGKKLAIRFMTWTTSTN